jgi:hypothetical protein
MLAVFQEVAKDLRNEEVGRLATFDLMYDGIAASIRGDMQTTIKMAERQLGDGIEIRVLKALFLLKWVREYKASPRNVAILLIDRADLDIRAHEQTVTDALERLQGQSYLQRNGDLYEFLTDKEKDIETEIKNTEIDESQVAELLSQVLFTDVLRDPKIHYLGNGQDYPYARKLDDQLIGKDADVAINLITPDHFYHSDPSTIATQNVGKTELLAILPADARLIEEAWLYLRTKKYVQQNSGGADETRKAILDQRAQQNSERRTTMQKLASDLLGIAPLYLNGARLDSVSAGDARNRFGKACQELISFSFPNLRMLKGSYDDNSLSRALLDQDDLLAGGVLALSEPEQEVLTYVTRNQSNGERTTVEEIIRNFGRRPYGWPSLAVLTLVSRLFRMGKVELRTTELLDAPNALILFRNSRQHGNVRVRLQEQFDTSKVNTLKAFHDKFFDRLNGGQDARSVGQATADAFAAEARELKPLIDQVNRYHFLELLRPSVNRINGLVNKDYSYLLSHHAEFCDDLLVAKERLISPIKAFMNGPQRGIYDDAISFLREEEANFAELPADQVEPLRTLAASTEPYRGSTLPVAKAAVTKLRAVLAGLLQVERDQANAVLNTYEGRLKTIDGFTSLDEARREQILATTQTARNAIATARFVTGIRDRLQRYINQEYPGQLALTARLLAPKEQSLIPGKSQPAQPEPKVAYTPAASLRPECSLLCITNRTELDQWLSALRKAAEAELDKGNRITL